MLCIAQPAFPQNATGALDLEAAAREAVSWHPSIVEAAAQLDAQQQRVEEVEAGYYPQVTGGVEAGYDSSLRGDFRPRASLDVSQRIWDFGKLSSELTAERAGVRATQARVLLAVDAIVRDTSYSLIEVLRGTELLDAAHAQLEGVGSIGRLVEARHSRGAATRSDALQTEARVDGARGTIKQIEAELNRWQSNLAFLLGRDEPAAVASQLPEALRTACRAEATEWDSVPAVDEAEARLEQADALFRRERADRFPTVTLGAGARTDLGDPFRDSRSDYTVGFNVSTSLFNGGATGARMRGADHARAAARAAAETARLEAARLVSEARTQLASLEERRGTLERRFATMRTTRELYSLQYLELGTRTLVDLLNAEQELSQIRFDMVNSKYDLLRLGVDCLYATGRLRAVLGLEGMVVDGVAL